MNLTLEELQELLALLDLYSGMVVAVLIATGVVLCFLAVRGFLKLRLLRAGFEEDRYIHEGDAQWLGLHGDERDLPALAGELGDRAERQVAAAGAAILAILDRAGAAGGPR